MCKMGMIRQSCFTLSGLSILESKSTFSFKIFCPLLSEETFSDSWKYAFGLPVFLPDCQLLEEKHNILVSLFPLRSHAGSAALWQAAESGFCSAGWGLLKLSRTRPTSRDTK